MADLGLQGKRVVVTGAAGGLGRAFALGFAQAGAKVLAADVNADGIAETARLTGGHAQVVDVTNAASCRDLAVAVERLMGGVDIGKSCLKFHHGAAPSLACLPSL